MQTFISIAVSAALVSGHYPVPSFKGDWFRPATVIPVNLHSGVEQAVQDAISSARDMSAPSGGVSMGRGNGNGNGNVGVGNGNNNTGNNNGNNNTGNFNGNNNSGNNNGNDNSGNNNGNNNATDNNGNGNASSGNGNGSAAAPKPARPKPDKASSGGKPKAKPAAKAKRAGKGEIQRNRVGQPPKDGKRPCQRRTILGIAVNNCNR